MDGLWAVYILHARDFRTLQTILKNKFGRQINILQLYFGWAVFLAFYFIYFFAKSNDPFLN